MNLLEKIIEFLSFTLKEAPTPYGWFHLLFLSLTIIISLYIAIKLKHCNETQNKRLLLTIGLTLIVFEVYKQLVFSVDLSNWDYGWYYFPFQFCSVPMYVIIIVCFLKEGRLRNIMYSFLGTFCLFAGLAVMLYPNDVFINTLGISIQTMVHHGAMVVIGVYCLASRRAKIEHRSIVGTAIVFITLVLIALMLNIVLHKVDGVFNMFFIGPYYPCHLPILSVIYEKAPYFIFLIAYVLGFMLVAYIILLIAIGLDRLIKKIRLNRQFI